MTNIQHVKHHRLVAKPSAIAIALLAPCGLHSTAWAQADPALIALTRPGQRVELGVAAQDRYAAKADEFTGLSNKTPVLIGNLDLEGGGAYDSSDARRWWLSARDLGTRSRSLEAAYGVQGRWRLRLGYGELQRHQSDSYQTPYLGVGGSTLTLPSNWQTIVVPRVNATAPNARGLSPDVTASGVLVNGVLTAPTTAQTAQATAMQAADLPAFRAVPLSTQRTRSQVELEFELGSGWSANGGLTYDRKTGLKPLGAPSRFVGGDTSSILPIPVDEDDHKFALGLAYTGQDAHWQGGYEASTYTNHAPAVTWSLWASPSNTATLATAPSNVMHKLWMSGSLVLGEATRLTAAASRAKTRQDEPFLSDTTAPLVAAPSANARVTADSASLKLSHKLTREWHLGAGAKYELRENRTPVGLYGFYDLNNAPAGTSPFAYLFPSLTGLGTNFNINANTPFSRRSTEVSVDADWRFALGQRLRFTADSTGQKRYCMDSWINCANAPQSREDSLGAEWRGSLNEEVQARLSFKGANRKVDYDENAFLALVPMAGRSPSTATGALAGSTAYGTLTALGLNGWGPNSGLNPAAPAGSALAFYFPLNNVLSNTLYANQNRISELPGMRRYDQADRRREKLQGSVQWQASEALSVQAAVDASTDRYLHSTYGLQRVQSQAVHLDGSYARGERWSASLFGSFETQRTRNAGNTYTANSAAANVNGATVVDGGCFPTLALRNASNKIDPCLDWTSNTNDRSTTLGLSFTASRLVGDKLSLTGSAVVSRGSTDMDVTGGSYVNNPFAGIAGNASSAIAAFYIPATPFPTVQVRSTHLQMSGTWKLDDSSAIRLALAHQQRSSSDFSYEGLQDGVLTQVLPTREQAPQYRVNRIGVSYVMIFR